jgi:hypothetical protein
MGKCRFWLSYTSQRGNMREAAPAAGDSVHVRGWETGIKVTPRPRVRDEFDIYLTTGSHETGHDIQLGTVKDTPDGPVWESAAGPAVTSGKENHGLARHAIELAIRTLDGGECMFWACEGPDKPFEGMKTCRRCTAIQDLRAELARIAR